MIQDFIIPFFMVGLAELGDKTQLAIVCMSAQTKRYVHLLLGVILAFIVADGIAVLLGGIMQEYIPVLYLKLGAAVLFITFGMWMLAKRKEGEDKCELKKPFASGFILILVSEMGDKTQLSAALLAAQYNPYIVFLGVIASLALLSVLAVYLGRIITARIKRKTISVIAGLLFIAIGVWNLLAGWYSL